MPFEYTGTEADDALLAHRSLDDDRAPLALAAGLAAGLVAGGIWAALVYFTGYEIGFAAWGVGLLVGFAMGSVTVLRTRQLATAAAFFAVLGLLAGKAFIFAGSTGAIASDYANDDGLMAGAVAWQLYDTRQLDASSLAELDATIAAGDTLSDAVWAAMLGQAGARIAGMSETEREEAAMAAAQSLMGGIGLVGGIRAQLTPFDLLWILLAVGSAFRMMAPPKSAEPAAMQPA